MIEVILLVLKASIMLAVFAIGLKATFADATFLIRRPGQLLRAFPVDELGYALSCTGHSRAV